MTRTSLAAMFRADCPDFIKDAVAIGGTRVVA
jgi:hypothetical protein